MGADLIGYMAFGPIKISNRNKKKAIERLEIAIDLMESFNEIKDDGDEKAIEDFCDLVDKKFGYKIPTHSEDNLLDMLSAIANIEIKNAEDAVTNFIDFWNKADGRDTMARALPNHSPDKVLFCGERTWGDTPDGYGYKQMEMAVQTGIAKMFGIH